MPVIATPAPSQPPSVAEPLLTRRPEEAYYENCPIRTKQRAILVDQGLTSYIEWEWRDRQGRTIDLTPYLEGSSESESSSLSLSEPYPGTRSRILVRFANCQGQPLETVEGKVVSLAEGIIAAGIPEKIRNRAGIYTLGLAIEDIYGRKILADKGLLSVERSVWRSQDSPVGPPTLGELRMAMRDTAEENDLLLNVEFSDSEILWALVRPIQQWNELPPPVAPFCCETFPFTYHWTRAAIGLLLETAAHHFRRNKQMANQGNVLLTDKDRDRPYLEVAAMLMQEWMGFIRQKKAEINLRGAFGVVFSPYARI